MASASPPAPAGFPNCPKCALLQGGSAGSCFACAGKVLPQQPGPTCSICGQSLESGRCGNRICHDPRRGFGVAHIVAVHKDSLRQVNLRYKNDGRTGWAVVLARILLGYLDAHVDPDTVDLIIPNPSSDPSRQHNERIIEAARREDDSWPFDYKPWAVTKKTSTPKSANNGIDEKIRVAKLHADALDLSLNEIKGQRILVYDDVFTTGAQLDQVGRRLISAGAASVDGLVLARAPWR